MSSQNRKALNNILTSLNLQIDLVKEELGNEMVKNNARGVHNLNLKLKRLLSDREGLELSLAR
jgi:hypothetical protein